MMLKLLSMPPGMQSQGRFAIQKIWIATGSLNLAKGAAIAGIKRLVGVGTCFEYDLTAGVLSADTPLNPSTPYAGAKAALYMGLSSATGTINRVCMVSLVLSLWRR